MINFHEMMATALGPLRKLFMQVGHNIRYPKAMSEFHGRYMPETATPVGYAALIDAYQLAVPLPITLSAIGPKHKVYTRDQWAIYTPRHQPRDDLTGHLTFALRYEGLDLAVLKTLFRATGPAPITEIVNAQPSSQYARRIWFLYEWLLGTQLDLPDASSGRYVPAVDPTLQWDRQGANSTRHRVRNNLPGSPAFCPMIFKTPGLEGFVAQDLQVKARELVAAIPADIVARTAAFLLLKDSRSSFQIEGEQPSHQRIARWGQIIGTAGNRAVTRDELERLQRIVIGDDRFVQLGLRNEGGFVGEHDRHGGFPIPDHISARHEDLPELVGGLSEFETMFASEIDPVMAAASIAFGFVYIHPFEDGNGRLHRYLIHHILAKSGFNPVGLVFPVSAVILDRIGDYKSVLESYSKRLLPHIQWQPTDKGNVEVTNETADFYRFFDATPHAQFLYECVARTIEIDLPNETLFLRNYDAFTAAVEALVDMPARRLDQLFRFLHQNDGKLSKRARSKEFESFTDEEVQDVEDAYHASFLA